MSNFMIGLVVMIVVIGVALLSYYLGARIVWFRGNRGQKRQKQKP